VLFELLIVGVLKNTSTCRVYYRESTDLFLLEIPNSPGEKTARALRFCSLLPTKRLTVGPDTIDLKRPIFTNPECTRLSSPEATEITFVCKFLRAYRANKFKPGDSYDANYSAYEDVQEITAADCYGQLAHYCNKDGHPSFLIFNSFLQFMYSA